MQSSCEGLPWGIFLEFWCFQALGSQTTRCGWSDRTARAYTQSHEDMQLLHLCQLASLGGAHRPANANASGRIDHGSGAPGAVDQQAGLSKSVTHSWRISS